jgi:hypothetical protein
MNGAAKPLEGLDFAQGISLARVANGAMLLRHAHNEAVLITRRSDELFAIGATFANPPNVHHSTFSMR